VKLFDKYADPDDATNINMEGIVNLCTELDIDPLTDIRILVFLWKMGSKEKPQQISKEEWLAGCTKHKVDTIDHVRKMLPSLDTGFLIHSEFKDFFKFCFQFNREGTHKTLDRELVVELLRLVCGTGSYIAKERLDTYCDFLLSHKGTEYVRITLDQWTSFLDFCEEVPNLEYYDETTSAWPVLIDEYVEHMQSLQQKK